MISNPKVSVIVTCYNQGKYLEDSISSVINQTWTNWECWIIDDGSTDNSILEARKYEKIDPRIKVFSQKNSGVSNARNKGLELVSGDFIQFLDADDILHHGKFLSQLELFNQFPEVDLCFGSSRYFFDGEEKTLFPLHPNGAIPVDLTKEDSFQVEMIFKNNVCTNCSLLIKKKAVEKVKFRQVIYEDWIFNLELALNEFIFHYHPALEAYSYIRMTKESQMNKHTSHLNKFKEFEKYKYFLVTNYGYPFNQDLVKLNKSDLNSKIKKLIKSLLPPVMYDAISTVKKNLLR